MKISSHKTISKVSYALSTPLRLLLRVSWISRLNKSLPRSMDQSPMEYENLREALDKFAIISRADLTGRITYANEKFCEISKYKRNELMGNDHKIVNSGYHSREYIKDVWETIKKGKSWVGEFRNRAKDGSIYWVNSIITPLKDNTGKIKEYISIRFDTTEIKESNHRQAILLDNLNNKIKELNDFSHVVSHDLKSPLRGMEWLIHWFQDNYDMVLNAEGKEALKLMLFRTHRMQSTIKGLLDLAKIDRVDLATDHVDTKKIIGETIDLIGLPDNFKIKISSSLPLMRMNPILLQQLFQNLISNAIKHNEKPQGTIDISFQEIDKHGEITICDNGPGIDPKYHQRIFELFETLTVKEKDNKYNSGIGLTIVKKIVNKYQGEISIQSTLGQGTAFSIRWPKALFKPLPSQ